MSWRRYPEECKPPLRPTSAIEMTDTETPIVAICGKGGVGKTVLCTLLARSLLDMGVRPLLLIDADPVSGLTSALGEQGIKTIGSVRSDIIATVRQGEDAKQKVADQLDYLVLEALIERDGYALFAMGRKDEKGCYCPVNALLRDAIDQIIDPFSAVLIDAEAGIEQINRQVTRRTSRTIVVTDGSARSVETLRMIAEMVDPKSIGVVANRASGSVGSGLPTSLQVLGALPEDETLRQFDRDGRPLWELPADNPAVVAAKQIANELFSVGGPSSLFD